MARIYHPERVEPLLELTLPHGLLIAERACRDLRTEIAGQIPFSHRLTLGDLVRAYRWKATAERLLDLYRAGRLIVNPVNALLGEVWERLRRQSFGAAWSDLHRWLLQEYVRKLGFYAIELYSGRLTLTEGEPAAATPTSRRDLEQAESQAAARAEEPLRILVLGRSNAGKSSLINALFGRLTAPADVLPDPAATVAPYRLEREGLTAALVFDTPGIDTDGLPAKALNRLAMDADLVLWVTAAHRPDRQPERETLDRIRALWAARQDRHPPPLLAALSHIDLLRPPREWQPPYDLSQSPGPQGDEHPRCPGRGRRGPGHTAKGYDPGLSGGGSSLQRGRQPVGRHPRPPERCGQGPTPALSQRAQALRGLGLAAAAARGDGTLSGKSARAVDALTRAARSGTEDQRKLERRGHGAPTRRDALHSAGPRLRACPEGRRASRESFRRHRG